MLYTEKKDLARNLCAKSPQDKWRQNHKKCIYCKYCSLPPAILTAAPPAWCEVKKKHVNKRIPRYFCSAFELEKIGEFK